MPASATQPAAASGASLTPKGRAWPTQAASTRPATMAAPVNAPRQAGGASGWRCAGCHSSGAQARASSAVHQPGQPAPGSTSATALSTAHSTAPTTSGATTTLASDGATLPRIRRSRVSSTAPEAARKAWAL